MSKVLGFGVIGCGNIGPFHMDAITQIKGAKLVAISDVVEPRVKELAKKYNVEGYLDYNKMLERKDIDVVNICTPSGLHIESALAAAKAGKHLIVEKPLEITLEKCDKIIKAANDNKVKLCVIFPSRFSFGVRKLKEAIEKDRFGKIVIGDAYIKWYRSQEYYDTGKWRGTWEMDGGGALMNQSIHTIDILQWMMGPVDEVTAYAGTLLRKIKVEDTAVALLKFKNNAFGVIEGTTAVYPGFDNRLEIYGEKGSVVLVGTNVEAWEFIDKIEEDEQIKAAKKKTSSGASDPVKSITSEGHMIQIQDMVDAINNNKTPMVDGYEGRKAVELVLAIYKSAKEKKQIRLPL
ncbi:MAG: Gfo/Idh/MocA family oxidoreductase [Elusimicrobia bacterium]|nr:Gfo/Idh/MocA family oxidoreductase [Elusimicrobiota bacterium]